MNTDNKNADQNALSAKVTKFWDDFKQGKVIGYKLMAVLLILGAGIGVTWYIITQNRKANSQQWLALEEASSESSLEEISKNSPNTIQDRLARLQIARHQLGIAGIDHLGSSDNELRKKAIDNIEKAREAFSKLLDEFKTDPVFKVECLMALARAEAALVAVPVKEGQLTEFRGTIPKVVNWLDQVAAAAAPDTPWATDSKKLADSLRDPNSATAHEFFRVQQDLYRPPFRGFPGIEPLTPGFPKGPFSPPGVPEPISPPKAPGNSGPGGPTVPPGPMGTELVPSVVPLPKAPDPKAPNNSPPPPIIPEPKVPMKSPEPIPKTPEPKVTEPKAPDPKPPVAQPEKKPG